LLGVVAAGLTVAALLVLGDADTASRGAVRASTYLFVLAMAAVVAFACVLGAAAEQDALRSAVVAFGATSAALQVLGIMPRAAVNHRAAPLVDEQVVRLLLDLGHVTNFSSDLFLAGFLVTGSAVLVRRAGGAWANVGYAGAVAAVVAAATQGGAAGLVTLVILLTWLVGAGIQLALGPSGPPETARS
jgi:hypothetical protein